MRALPVPLGRFVWVVVLASLYYFGTNATVVRTSDLLELAFSIALPVFLVWWLAADARRTRYWPCFHYGWWVALLAPILVPHYLLRTRGRSGLRLALFLDLVMLAPLAAAYLGWWASQYLPEYLGRQAIAASHVPPNKQPCWPVKHELPSTGSAGERLR
jgi:hypothetical protein